MVRRVPEAYVAAKLYVLGRFGMTSKLLHAIVGVGIAVGAGTGCGGSSQSADEPPEGPDLSKFDPFCDATWPTTKGNPGPPACTDPMNECDPAMRLYCGKSTGRMQCDYTRYSSFCIDQEWVCHPDHVEMTECKCLGEPPPNYVCTETGWMMAGGSAG
jgi:hypothetical protein